jgi:hypothetical protein
MKASSYELSDERLKDLEALGELRERDLDNIEAAVLILRHRAMVKELKALGVQCRSEVHRHTDVTNFDSYNSYILVRVPGQPLPVEATIGECKRLIDTLRNLPVDEALQRWATKVESVEVVPYTEDNARRDTREARAELHRDMAAGKIPADMYSDLYRTTSFMDLAR